MSEPWSCCASVAVMGLTSPLLMAYCPAALLLSLMRDLLVSSSVQLDCCKSTPCSPQRRSSSSVGGIVVGGIVVGGIVVGGIVAGGFLLAGRLDVDVFGKCCGHK